MASEQKFIDFIIDQIGFSEQVANKKMFGEYGLYFDNKLFGLVCDNKLFMKPTQAGKEYIYDIVEASPYLGEKPCYLIEEKLDNREWLRKLVRITVNELSKPKPKKIKNRIVKKG